MLLLPKGLPARLPGTQRHVSKYMSEGTDGVNGSRSGPGGAGRFDSTGGLPEIRDGGVDFECFRQVLGAL